MKMFSFSQCLEGQDVSYTISDLPDLILFRSSFPYTVYVSVCFSFFREGRKEGEWLPFKIFDSFQLLKLQVTARWTSMRTSGLLHKKGWPCKRAIQCYTTTTTGIITTIFSWEMTRRSCRPCLDLPLHFTSSHLCSEIGRERKTPRSLTLVS